VGLLRMQQQQLAALKASRVLFRHQHRLRRVLRRPVPPPMFPLTEDADGDPPPDQCEEQFASANAAATSSEEVDRCPAPGRLLLHSLFARATQPSPLKPIFTRQEIEVSALQDGKKAPPTYLRLSVGDRG